MRKFPIWIATALVLSMTACSKDDDSAPAPEPEPQPLEAKTVNDLNTNPADNGGKPLYFSFTTGAAVAATDSASNKWDISLSTTTIKVNGGTSGPGGAAAQIVSTGFDDLAEAPEAGFVADGSAGLAIPTASNSGWYTYTLFTPPQHAILPIAGKTIVIKTANGKYAKVQILSYYKGNPNTAATEFADPATRVPSGYYTFRYMIQPDGSRKLK